MEGRAGTGSGHRETFPNSSHSAKYSSAQVKQGVSQARCTSISGFQNKESCKILMKNAGSSLQGAVFAFLPFGESLGEGGRRDSSWSWSHTTLP